jgi:hypothetical protein
MEDLEGHDGTKTKSCFTPGWRDTCPSVEDYGPGAQEASIGKWREPWRRHKPTQEERNTFLVSPKCDL